MALPGSASSSSPPRWALLPHPPGRPAEPVARAWLADTLGLAADALVITRDARGRPRLGGDCAHLDCNWSHSGGHLLVAVGEGVRIGADLERRHPHRRALDLARRFFAPAEAEWLAGLEAERREAAFAQLWCAKEAVLKAHGHGLSFGLHRLRFDGRGTGLELVETDPALGAPALWTLHRFGPAPGLVAAVAWRRPGSPPSPEAAYLPG